MSLSTVGALSGTPRSPFTVNVTATDSETPTAPTGSAGLSLMIGAAPPPPLAITSTSPLPNGQLNVPYRPVTLTASGGVTPYTRVSVGACAVPCPPPLPPGLTVSPSGVIGTPTASGTFTDSIAVSDAETPIQTASQPFSITITNPALTVTTTSLPGGQVGVVYQTTVLGVSGGTGPYTWAVTSGNLPDGLSLGTDGTLSGTAAIDAVTDTFAVTASDSETPAATGTATFTIVIKPAAPQDLGYSGVVRLQRVPPGPQFGRHPGDDPGRHQPQVHQRHPTDHGSTRRTSVQPGVGDLHVDEHRDRHHPHTVPARPDRRHPRRLEGLRRRPGPSPAGMCRSSARRATQ